jgi:GNAT superfamily N-acetyltransferase
MNKWTSHLTRSGFRLQVRAACPDDEGIVTEFFAHVTPEDLRFRFLADVSPVEPSHIRTLTRVDHQQIEDFLAFTEDRSMMVASAMLACDKAMERGEVAIVIRATHKHKGIGWELLAHVVRYAETLGLSTIESIESRDNHAAIELERAMGFTAKPVPDDPTLFLISLKLKRQTLPANLVSISE